jgi:GT2 family glycosyltransferase
MAARSPRVSVVLPTYNRAERAERLLLALAAQDTDDPFEVVVVNDASSDDTGARLARLATSLPFRVSVVTNERNQGPAMSRNRGWRLAKGDSIAFVDDDCVPDNAWLGALIAALKDADIAVGRTRPPDDQLDRIGPFSAYLDIGHNQSFSTCNIAYRRDVLEKTGGFDESFGGANGEDTDLGLRATKAGCRDAFAPDALVWHDVSASDFGSHIKRLRHIEWLPALVARHPEARQNLDAGMFLRSVDKAVLICWIALLAQLARPRHTGTRLFTLVGAGLYVWQFNRSHYRARSTQEWATSIPLGFVADSYALFLLMRGSAKHHTVLL